jgi:hypothetical protein
MNPADEISQRERRQVLENDRKVHDSYHNRALNDIEASQGGRFAAQSRTEVIGAASQYPRLPDSSPWAQPDGVGPEPFIDGRDIPEPVGEVHEIEASLNASSSPAPDDGVGAGSGSPPSNGPAPTIRRRL